MSLPEAVSPGSKVVRFIHSHGCHSIVTTEAKAKEHLNAWRNKQCDFFMNDEKTWAVKASEVCVIEIIDYSAFLEAQKQAQKGKSLEEISEERRQLPLSFLPKKSGVA